MQIKRSFEDMEDDFREKQFIDIRDEADVKRGKAENAVNIPADELETRLEEIDKSKPVYLMCYSGAMSLEKAEFLREQGYEAYSLTGGYRGYIVYRMSLE